MPPPSSTEKGNETSASRPCPQMAPALIGLLFLAQACCPMLARCGSTQPEAPRWRGAKSSWSLNRSSLCNCASRASDPALRNTPGVEYWTSLHGLAIDWLSSLICPFLSGTVPRWPAGAAHQPSGVHPLAWRPLSPTDAPGRCPFFSREEEPLLEYFDLKPPPGPGTRFAGTLM